MLVLVLALVLLVIVLLLCWCIFGVGSGVVRCWWWKFSIGIAFVKILYRNRGRVYYNNYC